MSSVFVVDACRTPIGKVKGSLAEVRPDHLAAGVLKALLDRNPTVDPAAIDDVYWGAANQAGAADHADLALVEFHPHSAADGVLTFVDRGLQHLRSGENQKP